MSIPKDLWIKNIVESIKKFASSEFQEKGWIKGQIHDYCTYTESMCKLFDDCFFDEVIDEKAKELGFSDEQINKLDAFRKALCAVDSKYGYWEDPRTIVDDPAWPTVRSAAKEALKSLGIERYLDPSKEIFKICLLETIKDIAGPEFQEMAGFQEQKFNENPLQETVQKFFKNYKAKEIIDHYKDYEVTENQVIKLTKLYDALKAYQDKAGGAQDLRKILEDPEWHQIQVLAGETVQEFDFKP